MKRRKSVTTSGLSTIGVSLAAGDLLAGRPVSARMEKHRLKT
jgi:hypothetical protein